MNPDFAEMLSALSAEGVRFLIVGAYALAAHGLPRATGDIDLWVQPTPANAARVLRALRRFGAPLFDLKVEDLSHPGIIFQLGLPPRRIDLITAIDGVGFARAWKNRIQVQLAGVEVSVLGRDDLARNKRAAGRPKDLLDLMVLTADAKAAPKATRAKKHKRRQS